MIKFKENLKKFSTIFEKNSQNKFRKFLISPQKISKYFEKVLRKFEKIYLKIEKIWDNFAKNIRKFSVSSQ